MIFFVYQDSLVQKRIRAVLLLTEAMLSLKPSPRTMLSVEGIHDIFRSTRNSRTGFCVEIEKIISYFILLILGPLGPLELAFVWRLNNILID